MATGSNHYGYVFNDCATVAVIGTSMNQPWIKVYRCNSVMIAEGFDYLSYLFNNSNVLGVDKESIIVRNKVLLQ
jgi:hypothetical protein